jgi:hypothetical protein
MNEVIGRVAPRIAEISKTRCSRMGISTAIGSIVTHIRAPIMARRRLSAARQHPSHARPFQSFAARHFLNVRYWRVADVGDIVKQIDEWKAASDD